jgi:PAS domain S-box-containing protein
MSDTWTGAGDEAALRLLATRVPAILWSTDRSLRVVSCTGRGLDSFRRRGSGLRGLTIPECFGVEEDERTSQAAHQRALGGTATTYDVRWRDHWFRCHVAPLMDSRGQISGVIGAALEITESKQLEAQLIQAHKMESVGRLAGGIAHDFNNLLTSILGYAELAAQRLEVGPPPRQELEAIKEAGLRAADLTRQLLAFSRKQVLQARILDLNAVAKGFEQILRRTIGEHIDFRTVLQPELGSVLADRGQVEQILMNLVVNARDAMPSGGRLIVRTCDVQVDEALARQRPGLQPGRYVAMAVEDTGVGMDAATQAHLFEPFFTTKELGRGTGLGLSTVYGIVKQSGGHIAVESAPGKGSRFEVLFPRVEAKAQNDTSSVPVLGCGRGTETVLVVEDELAVLDLACRILKSAGYSVLTARNGLEALEIVRGHSGPIDLLLTDVVMPRIAGPELARQFHALRPGSRVLYMSGYTGETVGRQGVLPEGVQLVEKPFTPDVLTARVRKTLDRTA